VFELLLKQKRKIQEELEEEIIQNKKMAVQVLDLKQTNMR